MSIYISGSVAFDRIMTFPGQFSDHILPDKLHILNVCFLVDGLTEKFGGTAGNVAYTLSLLGKKPTVIATSGRDFGPYEKHMRKHGLPLDGIRTIDEELTAGAYITTDKKDNQITGFNPGAMKHSADFKVDSVRVQDTWAICSPGNMDDMLGLPERYKKIGVPYIFDPGQQITAIDGKDMTKAITGAAVLIANDYEMEMIRKNTGLTMAEVRERAETVIVTLGEKGSVIYSDDGEAEVPSAPAKSVLDPTGAGDAYRAGLLYGLTEGMDMETSCRIGAVCAAYCVEQHGTQEHSFDLAACKERYGKAFGSTW